MAIYFNCVKYEMKFLVRTLYELFFMGFVYEMHKIERIIATSCLSANLILETTNKFRLYLVTIKPSRMHPPQNK